MPEKRLIQEYPTRFHIIYCTHTAMDIVTVIAVHRGYCNKKCVQHNILSYNKHIKINNIAASSNVVAKQVRWPRRNFRHLVTAVYLASFAVAYSLAKQRIRDMTSLSALAGFEPLTLTLPGHQLILSHWAILSAGNHRFQLLVKNTSSFFCGKQLVVRFVQSLNSCNSVLFWHVKVVVVWR